MVWKEITAGLYVFSDVGESVEGTVIGREETQFNDVIVLRVTDNTVCRIPIKTALENKLANMKEGTRIKITYLGKKKSERSGREYEDYRVDVWSEGAA